MQSVSSSFKSLRMRYRQVDRLDGIVVARLGLAFGNTVQHFPECALPDASRPLRDVVFRRQCGDLSDTAEAMNRLMDTPSFIAISLICRWIESGSLRLSALISILLLIAPASEP